MIPIRPLTYFVNDKPKLLEDALSLLKGKRLDSLTPDILKKLSKRKLKAGLLKQLEKLDKETIMNVLDGKVKCTKPSKIKDDKVAEVVKEVIPAKKLKHKLKKSISNDVAVHKKLKRKKETEHQDSESPKKSKKDKKKKGKKKLKASSKAEPTIDPQDKPILTGRTLMELLELEYRAKAIKALLKTQDIDTGKIDEVLALNPSSPPTIQVEKPEKQSESQEEEMPLTWHHNPAPPTTTQVEKPEEPSESEEEDGELTLCEIQNAVAASPSPPTTTQFENTEEPSESEEEDGELPLCGESPNVVALNTSPPTTIQVEKPEQSESEEEDGELNMCESPNVVALNPSPPTITQFEKPEETSESEEDDGELSLCETQNVVALNPPPTTTQVEKPEQPSENEEEDGELSLCEIQNVVAVSDNDDPEDKLEQLESEKPQETELILSESQNVATISDNNIAEEKLDEQLGSEEEETPLTWYHRWYTSKKVQRVVKANRVLGKLRSKLRQEKPIADLPKVDDKIMKDENDAQDVPIVGSLEEYERIFGKQVPPPRYDNETIVINSNDTSCKTSDVGTPSDSNTENKLEEPEEEEDDLWGDIMGVGS